MKEEKQEKRKRRERLPMQKIAQNRVFDSP
jgi:hypothetical protein